MIRIALAEICEPLKNRPSTVRCTPLAPGSLFGHLFFDTKLDHLSDEGTQARPDPEVCSDAEELSFGRSGSIVGGGHVSAVVVGEHSIKGAVP